MRVGLQNEMEECDVSPAELFAGLGLVIVESRVPHLSPKGHVEGPHIPTALGFHSGHNKHVCSNNNFLCGRMEAVRRQMTVLWKNHIPMCIEVLLFPDCEHGSHQAALQDVTLPSGREPAVLLEQWTVQVLPRRGGESVVRARELYQAMKSYLHFSQLSAWLNLTHGKAPRNVSYRVSPPAEFCISSFQEVPEWHTFPVCSMSKASAIKVTVGTLPRRPAIIHVPCLEFHPLGHQFVRTAPSGAPVVTTKAPCRPQQALLQPQQEDSRMRGYWGSPIASPGQQHMVGKHRKSPLRDRNAGYGCEGEKPQPVAGVTSSGAQQGYTRRAIIDEDHKSQVAGESRGRGRESPGLVPTHLDFSKIRKNPHQPTQQPFGDFRQLLVLPQPQVIGSSDIIPQPVDNQSVQRPPFPAYPHPHQQHLLCPPPQPYHNHQPPPPQQPPYLNPSLATHPKRSSPVVPWMEQLPFQHQPHYQQQPPYNAFLYNRPRLYHPQTPEDMPSYEPMQYLGAIPNRAPLMHQHHHTSPPDTQPIRDLFPHNPPFAHYHQYVDHPGYGYHLHQPDPPSQPQPQQYLKVESPKVLFSNKSPGQVFYTHDEPWQVNPVAAREGSQGTDGSSPETDKFLKTMSTSIQPLSPEEIQSYLSRLSIHQNHRSRKDISPIACKSLTEKDFVQAETTLHQPVGEVGYQQQLPNKLARALQEAKGDGQLSAHSTTKLGSAAVSGNESGRVSDQKMLDEESVSPDDRSVTPTPTLSPHSVEDASTKLSCSQDEAVVSDQSRFSKDDIYPSIATMPCARGTGSRSSQTKVLRPTMPRCITMTAGTRPGTAHLVSSDSSTTRKAELSPPKAHSFSEGTPVTTAVPDTIQKGLRCPRSLLSKQLFKADHTENGGATVHQATTENNTSDPDAVASANGVNITIQSHQIRHHSPSPESTSNGHSHTYSSLSSDEGACIDPAMIATAKAGSGELRPFVSAATPTIRTFKDKQSNNVKGSSIVAQNTPQDEEDVSPTAKVHLASRMLPAEPEVAEVADTRKKALPLLQSLLKRDLSEQIKSQDDDQYKLTRPVPTPQECASFHCSLDSSTNMIFHATTGLPLQSSPAPIKKRASACFDYDNTLINIRAIKNSLSCANLEEPDASQTEGAERVQGRFYSASAPASTNCLLGNFEESLLNGRIEPSGVVEGFTAELGASGAFCPKHIVLPVTAFFFNLSDDNAPSPYLGHINLESLGRHGYHVPKKGTVQVTLFNPNKTVVKMFVVMYNLSHMPANCQTFLRQRTLYMPVSGSPSDIQGEPVFLRYLIHLRFTSSKSGNIYLHTDLRMIFARDKFEYDSSVASYELCSFTEGPVNPKFSPKR